MYASGAASFSIKDGMLVPSGAEGELKAIAKTDAQDIKSVSVDIIPGPSGLINATLYIGASNAGNANDQIDALAFLVESFCTGWSDAPNRIDLVTGEFPVWKEHNRLISETGNGNALFKNGVKEPLNLRVDFEEDMVTVTLSLVSNSAKYVQTVYACDPQDLVGSVGLRVNNSDTCFDNFKIGYDREVPEKLHQGLEFSEAGAKAQLNKATGTIPQTVEAWVKVDPDSTAPRTAIIGAFTGPYTADAKVGDWALFTNGSGVLWWYEKNAQGSYSSARGTTIKTGEWVHVAVTRSEGCVKYYVNGVLAATQTGTVVLDTASNKAPTIGYCEYGGENYNYMQGQIGDVTLWSTTRTDAQIQEDMFTEASGNETGLMSHWGLDEQAGTVFWDSASTGNHGTIAGNTGLSWTEGSMLNEGLEFNEVGAKVQLSQASGTVPQTVEAWIRLDKDSAASRTGIISAFTGPYTADAQKGDWALFTGANGNLWWYEKNANGQYSTAKGATIKTGEWTHVAITRDEGIIKYYINGKEEASVESAKIVLGETSSKVPTLGYCEYGGENYNYLDGALGDVRLWTTTRTAEQIRADMYAELEGTETGLMSYWKLDELGGVTVADSTATANHGTLDAAWLDDSQGLEFAGNRGVVASLSKGTDYIPQTVEAWVKVDKNTAASRTGIISAFTGPYTADAQKGDWALFTDGNGRLWWYEKNAKGQYSTAKGASVKTGDWVHVAITRGEGIVKYYINGAEAASVESEKIVLNTPSTRVPTLGYCEYGGENVNYLDGALRDVRLWSTTRTAEEIKANMNVTLSGTEAGLMSYWKLDEQNGTVIKDSASAGNDGTLAVGVEWTDGIAEQPQEQPEQTQYTNEGFNFSQNKTWITSKESDISPDHTIEAWVKIPKAVKSANMIVQNNLVTRYEFSVTSAGAPRLYWKDENDKVTEIVVSNTKVNTGDWTHVAFVSDASAKTITCYVNGTAVHVTENVELKDIALQKLYVGNPFMGILGDLRIWNKALSAQQIQSSMNTAYTQSVDGLMLNAPLTETNPTTFSDLSGNDNAIVQYKRVVNWTEDTSEPGAYSIVVIPDQQVLTALHPEDLNRIYQWIADNAEKENIKFAINLGDITDYNSEKEWLLSLEVLEKIQGIVPYSFVPGNHEYFIPGSYKYADYGYRNLTEMNKYFGNIYDNQPGFGGTYDGGVENNWHTFEACGNQYLVFGFEYAPRDSVLQWASEIIEAHPNHQVILATHGYMNEDGSYILNPSYGFLYEEGKEDPNGAKEMWDEFVSQHENIIMTLCGHVGMDDIVTRYDTGVNGNQVVQMLIDGQWLDTGFGGVGMLALMRFTADGQQTEVSFFAPGHGKNGEDEYINENLFTVQLPAPKRSDVAQVGETVYSTVTEAAENANGQTITMLADTDEAITISTDVTIDLAGYSLSNVTVAEGGKLNLIDTCTGGTAAVTGNVETFTEADGITYLVVGSDNVYSAHSYDVTITHITLDPKNDALGYKAALVGDETVQGYVVEMGFNLWVTEDQVITRTKAASAMTLRLKNILANNGGEMDIHATAFVTLNVNGETYTKTCGQQTTSMKQTLQMVDAAWSGYSDAQKTAVRNLCNRFSHIIEEWKLENIFPIIDIPISE
ncbi:MAG: metallophosphoesterase [Oscillospiraceae bacterium]|nr:metallophosphoesterase [Oscillospiraceae bacterium]